MIRRRPAQTALAVAFVLVAAACGTTIDDIESADPEPTVTTTTTTTTLAPSTTTTPSTTTAPPPTTTVAPEPRAARLLFTGDLIPHSPVRRAGAIDGGWDFTPLYAEVQPIIEGADLAICHLETPLSIDDTNLGSFPLFNAPRAFGEAVRDVGYNGCSLASNHSYDRRAQGALDTLTVMQDIGLPYAGQAASAEEDMAPVLYEVNGITIAHISATYSLNGFVLPADQQYLVDLIDPADIIQEANIARARGAEFVVVSLHWGAEYRHEPINQQNEWLEEILPSDAVDLIIGHHAHVVQPVDKLDDEWVVFGLGNFLSNQSPGCCAAGAQDGMIATVELVESDTGEIEAVGVHYIPTWVDRRDGYVIRIADPDRADLPAATMTAITSAYERTLRIVSGRLGEDDGLTIGLGLEPGAESVVGAVAEPEVSAVADPEVSAVAEPEVSAPAAPADDE